MRRVAAVSLQRRRTNRRRRRCRGDGSSTVQRWGHTRTRSRCRAGGDALQSCRAPPCSTGVSRAACAERASARPAPARTLNKWPVVSGRAEWPRWVASAVACELQPCGRLQAVRLGQATLGAYEGDDVSLSFSALVSWRRLCTASSVSPRLLPPSHSRVCTARRVCCPLITPVVALEFQHTLAEAAPLTPSIAATRCTRRSNSCD